MTEQRLAEIETDISVAKTVYASVCADLLAEVRRLKAELRDRGLHDPGCNMRAQPPLGPCICTLKEAIEG